jgi:predicted HicB family RNase H-like nuclease
VVRVRPELPRQLVIEAADQHVSLNRRISGRLGV